MFKSMNLARWIIVFSLIGSAVLGYVGYDLHKQRIAMEDALDNDVPILAKEMLAQSQEHTRLTKEYKNTGTGPQDNLKSYIVKQASRPEVQLGSPITNSRDNKFRGGVDKVITITPQFKDRGVDRTRVANFVHFLEQDSRRLRVTSIELEQEERSLDEHEISNDRWRWQVKVSVRSKAEDS